MFVYLCVSVYSTLHHIIIYNKKNLLFGYIVCFRFLAHIIRKISFFESILKNVSEINRIICALELTPLFRVHFNNRYSIIFASLTVFNPAAFFSVFRPIHWYKDWSKHIQKVGKSIFQVNLQLNSIESQSMRYTLINSHADFQLFLVRLSRKHCHSWGMTQQRQWCHCFLSSFISLRAHIRRTYTYSANRLHFSSHSRLIQLLKDNALWFNGMSKK